MVNFKYLKFSKLKKLRYINCNNNSKIYLVFLHGFMSDLEGEKPKNFINYCKKRNLGFLGIEYSGHGKSSGDFTKGNISKWSHEVKYSIKKIVRKKSFILVGSSMGSWLSLNQFKYFHKQILGFLGIGSAPEFLELLMWKKFSKKIKSERSLVLRELSDLKKESFYKKNINSKRKILFESENKNGFIHGYTDNYIRVKTIWSSNLVDSIVKRKLSAMSNDSLVVV